MKVLIIGINYAPEVTGIAPYSTAMAEYFAGVGHDVSVITGMPHYPSWQIDSHYKGRFWKHEEVRSVRVLRSWHYVPSKQSAVRRGLYEMSFLLSALPRIRALSPDVILGVVPSLSGGILARVASHTLKAPYGLLFQDLMGPAALESGVHGGNKIGNSIRSAEKWAVSKAQAVGIITNGFKAYVESLGVPASKIFRVQNWSHVERPRAFRTVTRRKLDIPEDAFVCLHAGNMGHKQALENVIDCARLSQEAGDNTLYVLMGDGNRREELEGLSERYALENVRFLPLQPADEFMNVLAAADILLVNQKSSVIDMSMPSKLTSYFMSGRPVIAAMSAHCEAAKEIAGHGAGLLVEPEDPEALRAAIMRLASDVELRSNMGRAALDYARTNLTAEAALSNLDGFLNTIAGRTEREQTIERLAGAAA